MERVGYLSACLMAVLLVDQTIKTTLLDRRGRPPLLAIGTVVRIGMPVRARTIAQRLGAGPLVLSGAWLVCAGFALVASARGALGGPVAQVALGAALGGAAGNLVDVLLGRGVLDYVRIGRWPAFNLADAAIVTGVIGVILAR